MPIKRWIEKDKKRVYAVLTGKISLDEMIATINDSVEDADFEPGFDVLSDHSGIEQPIATNQVKFLALHIEMLRNNFAGSRWAVVAKNEVSYGMMRMLSVYLEKVPMQLEVFYTLEDAEKWLVSHKKA
jgi:hypothetical protein